MGIFSKYSENALKIILLILYKRPSFFRDCAMSMEESSQCSRDQNGRTFCPVVPAPSPSVRESINIHILSTVMLISAHLKEMSCVQ